MTEIIAAFICGFLLATVFFWIIHRKQQQDWHAEYLRLMIGINEARKKVLDINSSRASIATHLRKLYHDEPIWPRG